MKTNKTWQAVVAIIGFGLTIQAQAAVLFDFDSGTPVYKSGNNVPFDWTSGGITASFNSSSGFSLQTLSSIYPSGGTLGSFSGLFLYPNSASSGIHSVLDVTFSTPLTSITFPFATTEVPDIDTPTPIRLTAYSGASSLGSTEATGSYGTAVLAMGNLTYNAPAGTSFDKIHIEKVAVIPGGMSFLLDNMSVTPIPEPRGAVLAGLILLGVGAWLRR